MKYVCMLYVEPARLAALSPAAFGALGAESEAYVEELRAAGHLVGGETLGPAASATSVRIQHGRPSVTDGPFAETREQLGGFVVLEARDLNEAIQLAAKLPPARLGGVEVRPVWRDVEESR